MTVWDLKKELDKYPGWYEVKFDINHSNDIHVTDIVDDVTVDCVMEWNGVVELSEAEE